MATKMRVPPHWFHVYSRCGGAARWRLSAIQIVSCSPTHTKWSLLPVLRDEKGKQRPIVRAADER